MKDVMKIIETLRAQLERHKHSGLKEYPTRTILIDPLLSALGWDVRDPDEVELEYPTVDGKSVDYAMKINRKPVFLLEAKQLTDPLDDVKSITQVVGYAANDGIEWCVLTNGVRYKVYKASEKAAAPDRLGTEIFTTGKVRKALDRLFIDAPQPLIRLIRKAIGDNSVTPSQVQQALGRIWDGGKSTGVALAAPPEVSKEKRPKPQGAAEYSETHHTEGKPSEVIELYRGLDRLCQDLAPGRITRAYKAMYVSWSLDKAIFCCAHLQQGGLRVWVKTDPKALDPSESFARDVSKIGHWGVGDVELAIDSMERLRTAQKFVRESFGRETRRQT